MGHWSNWNEFHRLERMGSTMYRPNDRRLGSTSAARESFKGPFRDFRQVGEKHQRFSLAGKFVLSGGMGGRWAALAARRDDERRIFLGIDVDPARIEKRLQTGYRDEISYNLDDALNKINEARNRGAAISVGLVGNCGDVLPELVRRGVVPDVLTDRPAP